MTTDEQHHSPPADSPIGGSSLSTRLCAAALILYALYYARALVLPIVTAVALYLTLRPLVRQGRRAGIPPALGAIGIIAAVVLVLSLGTYLVIDPARQTMADAPRHLSVAKEKLSFISESLRQVDEAKEELEETEEEAAGVDEEKPVPVEIEQPQRTSAWTYLSGTGNLISFLTICVALLYFLLASGDNLIRSLMRSLPSFSAAPLIEWPVRPRPKVDLPDTGPLAVAVSTSAGASPVQRPAPASGRTPARCRL